MIVVCLTFISVAFIGDECRLVLVSVYLCSLAPVAPVHWLMWLRLRDLCMPSTHCDRSKVGGEITYGTDKFVRTSVS